MSKILQDENALMNTKLGTPYYISPEVLTGKYDKGCDMWSIGVITFVLLTGEPPFCGRNAAELFKKIKTCDYDFVQPIWQSTSRVAQKFIQALIEPNVEQRLTVEHVINCYIGSMSNQVSNSSQMSTFNLQHLFLMHYFFGFSPLLKHKLHFLSNNWKRAANFPVASVVFVPKKP